MDYSKLIWSAVRKFFIIYIARELRMIFPTPMATAMTIRSMHNALGGERLAMMKMKALSIAFSCAIVLRVVSQYAIGILWDWHVSDALCFIESGELTQNSSSPGSISGVITRTLPWPSKAGAGMLSLHLRSSAPVFSSV